VDFNDFYLLACEKFGAENFSIKPRIPENISELNEWYDCNLIREDFENYKALWIIGGECPACKENLAFTFEW
jgi:hypothetical protein